MITLKELDKYLTENKVFPIGPEMKLLRKILSRPAAHVHHALKCSGPKSKEGCRVKPRQGKMLRAVLYSTIDYGSPNWRNALKNYCTIKRLILLTIKN